MSQQTKKYSARELKQAALARGIDHKLVYDRYKKSGGNISDDQLFAPPRQPEKFLGNTWLEWENKAYELYGIRILARNLLAAHRCYKEKNLPDDEILAKIQKMYHDRLQWREQNQCKAS